MDNLLFESNDEGLKSLNSDSINHGVDPRIIGITVCFMCNGKSTYRGADGEVYCTPDCEERKKRLYNEK
jgi:hypothetical protein